MDGISPRHTLARVNALELARLQFGATTVFHFIFVPMSSGLAACQARYHRSGDEVYLLMTRFWGTFMLTASGS
jgi:cytochrome bd ubiquinol oxidase subunit I